MFKPSDGPAIESHLSSSVAGYPNRGLDETEGGGSSTSTGPITVGSLDEEHTVDDGSGNIRSGHGESLEGPSRDEDGRSFRRHRLRNSGGFLLESAFAPSHRPNNPQQKPPHESTDVKGKRKIMDDGINISEKRVSHHRHRPRTSLGSSPLASVVTNAAGHGEEPNTNRQSESPARTSSPNSSSSRADNMAMKQDVRSNYGQRKTGGDVQPSGSLTPALGLETDPVEIVSLALNLSESRRRNFSAGRLSTATPVGGRRVVSMGLASPGHADSFPASGAGSSLRQHFQQARQSSRTVSPLSGKARGSRLGTPLPVQNGFSQGHGSPQAVTLSPLQVGLDHQVQYNLSDATINRAAKARSSMELFYEYRRLLQYLPPLSQSFTMATEQSARPPSSAGVQTANPGESPLLGRQYNPLQYIRNRRLRARNKMSLDAEATGWNDVEKVKAWVDKVVDQSQQAKLSGEDHPVLPEFQVDGQGLPSSRSSPPSSLSHHDGTTASRVRRPRLDWIITPADLLADAFWLEQGINKYIIEDRDGNKLIRQRPSLNPSRHQVGNGDGRSGNQTLTNEADRILVPSASEPKSSPIHQAEFDESNMERGRQRYQQRRPTHSLHERSVSWDGEDSRYQEPLTSRTSSKSSFFDKHNSKRGGKISRDSTVERDYLENLTSARGSLESGRRNTEQSGPSALEGEMSQAGEDERDRDLLSSGVNIASYHSKDSRLDKSAALDDRISFSRRQITSSPRASLDSNRDRRRNSIDELDTTAPSSPTMPNFVPSIAINLSPPPSRSTSPSKHPLKSKLNLLRPDRSKERRLPEDNDLALGNDLIRKNSRQASGEIDLQRKDSAGRRRLPSPTRKLFSRSVNDNSGKDIQRPEHRSFQDDKETKEPESRLRGIFRGRRIAELVGNEVSRVGDFFWKRDLPIDRTLQSSPVLIMPPDLSDSDPSDTSHLDSETKQNNISRISTRSDEGRALSRNMQGSDPQKYHMSNLPVFKPASKGDEPGLKPGLPGLGTDHIARQQAAQRDRGRSARFERLSPPKIDVRNASRSPHGETQGTHTESTAQSNGHIALNGGSISFEQGVNTPRKHSDILSSRPGAVGRGIPVTGLTGLDVTGHQNSNQRPNMEHQRQWSISDHGVSPSHGSATKREIAHIKALLLSSGIKAKEICKRAHVVREPVPEFLRGLSEKPLPRVPRSQEHILAARVVISNIELTQGALEEAKEQFRGYTIGEIHNRIKTIDDKIQNNLTPLLRACADDADAFSADLTTTQTLAVKQLNDSINQIFRRRRRRLKWIRRTGYVLLEWTLLGIMWWAWLIVVMIRLIKGGIGGIVGAVRWLFWL